MGSFVKSCALPAFFSQTMSRWPCRQIGRTFCLPGEAGLLTTTLPKGSCLALRPSLPAVSQTYLEMAASFLDPRGMRAISAKYFQTSCGLSPSMAFDI